MSVAVGDLHTIRSAIAGLPGDISHDAVGSYAPKLDEIYAPEGHAAALDPNAPVVQGSRGAGKSFWAGVLFNDELRTAAATAYPKLGLAKLNVRIGFSGIGGPQGIDREKLDFCLGQKATIEDARTFFWATVLRALEDSNKPVSTDLRHWMFISRDPVDREARISRIDEQLVAGSRKLLIVYDALDTMATSWPRRRLLTQALLEIVWAMRAYRAIRLKLFLRPDQIEDDMLRFVELPKLRTGAVRLTWSGTDLYGLFFARLCLASDNEAFSRLLSSLGLKTGSRNEILTRQWLPGKDVAQQEQLMSALAGPFMAEGKHGNKKGKTYDWPLKHLGDAFEEVTPRSFLGLMIAAAQYGSMPPEHVFSPKGIQHGLRAASKTRVDQLQQEFPWIKVVLAPLSGILMPQAEEQVFEVWRRAGTLAKIMKDAETEGYLPPVEPASADFGERELFLALEKIGVMQRRKDDRLDMPDLFRVAARLLKKGGTAPL